MDEFLAQAERLRNNLASLGARRLVALALVGLFTFAFIGIAGWQLSKPAYELLYSGLDRQDVSRIGVALRENNIAFDVGSDGSSVLVRYGTSAQARMLLAEKGLPHGASAGYELFDKMGSLGLTSFMQEVTRVRALEGELARSIQLLRGVKSARVHIVMPDEGSFRRARQPPSASVVLRIDSPGDMSSANAIRKLVAAAIPGMTGDHVTVLTSDGIVLASNDEGTDGAPGHVRTIERNIAQEVENNIRKTLEPILSLKNIQVSVAARINADKKQTEETVFNPESRVERSVRVIKENQVAQNNTQSGPASVERNLPQDKSRNSDGKQSTEENQKREEVTNYEVSSKRTILTSAGYGLESLSIAVLVNRASLSAVLGGSPTPDVLAKQLSDLELLIGSAAGLKRERGDNLRLSAIDFVTPSRDADAVSSIGAGEIILRQTGTIVTALAYVGGALLILVLGVRPVTRLLAAPVPPVASPTLAIADAGHPSKPVKGLDSSTHAITMATPADRSEDMMIPAPSRFALGKLERIVALDEELAASVLKQWIGEAAA